MSQLNSLSPKRSRLCIQGACNIQWTMHHASLLRMHSQPKPVMYVSDGCLTYSSLFSNDTLPQACPYEVGKMIVWHKQARPEGHGGKQRF